MINIVIFASGNGSNLGNTIQEINSGHVDNVVCKALIIDKEHAYTEKRTEKLHIPCVYVNLKAYADKEPYEQKILSVLREHQVELIIFVRYMRSIGKVLLESFPKHIINLHPAYLPNFPGIYGTQDAYKTKADSTRVTIHFVNGGVDTGEIIHQGKVTIDFTWSLETLEGHVHAPEYDMFPKVIKHIYKMIESEEA